MTVRRVRLGFSQAAGAAVLLLAMCLSFEARGDGDSSSEGDLAPGVNLRLESCGYQRADDDVPPVSDDDDSATSDDDDDDDDSSPDDDDDDSSADDDDDSAIGDDDDSAIGDDDDSSSSSGS